MAKQDLEQSKKVVKKTENTSAIPEVAQIEYSPNNTPFEYKENPNVFDILRQGREKRLTLEEQEKRAKTAAKIAALSDFFRALGGLAGGGDAPAQEFKSSPYLSQAFSEVNRLRNDKESYDRYYQQLYNTSKQNDYNQQLNNHLSTQKEENSRRFEAAKEQARAKNNINKSVYEANTATYNDTFEDRSLKERELAIKQQNADANSQRANTYSAISNNENSSKNTPFVSYTDKGTGIIKRMNKNQAMQLTQEVVKLYESIKAKGGPSNPLEQTIVGDISNMSKSLSSDNLETQDNAIRQIAQKYLAADNSKQFAHLYTEYKPDNTSVVPKPTPTQPTPKPQMQKPQIQQTPRTQQPQKQTSTPSSLARPKGSLLPK